MKVPSDLLLQMFCSKCSEKLDAKELVKMDKLCKCRKGEKIVQFMKVKKFGCEKVAKN